MPRDRDLAPFTGSHAAFVQAHLGGLGVVEIGAGRGVWARGLRDLGVNVWACDVQPRGPGVIKATHLQAAERDGAMLAIWPPDGPIIGEWIAARAWPVLILAFQAGRLAFGQSLDPYEHTGAAYFDDGAKAGGYSLNAYVRRYQQPR